MGNRKDVHHPSSGGVEEQILPLIDDPQWLAACQAMENPRKALGEDWSFSGTTQRFRVAKSCRRVKGTLFSY